MSGRKQCTTINVGSSTVKMHLMDGDRSVDEVSVSWSGGVLPAPTVDTVVQTVTRWPPADSVLHRFVHGGTQYLGGVLVDPAVRADLAALADLAPGHQAASLAVLDAVTTALPQTPQVAVFDTAFHASMPEYATTIAVPERWREDGTVRRFGFHGLSHAYASRRTGELLGTTGARIVVAHLGSGCSLAAVVDNRSVETTMGMTPLDGLVMGTRSGSVDPALPLALMSRHGLAAAEVRDALEHRSGLLALTGTADVRRILQRCASGPERESAQLGLDVFVHHIVLGVGAMTAAAGGLDALVFTGGVGENAAPVRAAVGAGLRHLGMVLDPQRNARADHGHGDDDIGRDGSGVRVFVVRSREECEMVRQGADALTSVGP